MTTPVDRLTTELAGRYEIDHEIGAGGMATVYLAQDIRHDRKVAVKVLRPELSAILGAERFLKEIRLTANLQHPHILPLHDSGTADGTVFYVMPYVEGESLRQRVTREKQLPVDDAVRIAREVASALDYAHRHGVVHRDIKPENILLHDGQALVADFGIALAVSTAGGGTRMTETGMSLGTPHYMSPEQAMGEREITARSDVYALGCVLYEMLVGEPPFTGPTAQAIIARVVTEEPRSLRLQRKTIPVNVEAAVNTALSKMPADRFSSAAQFSDALARHDYALPATSALRVQPAVPLLRRRAWAAAPWVLFALAAAAGAWGWMREPERPVTRTNVMLWRTSTPLTSVARFLALSPDGETMVYGDTVGGRPHLWLKERDRLDAVEIAGTTNAVSPVFSPDGEWIAFAADSKLKKVPRNGGSPITLSDSTATFPSIAWLDDGTILFTNANSDLLAISQDGGTPRLVFASDSAQREIMSVTGLPGSAGALIATCKPGCSDPDLRVLDLETGQTSILATEALRGWYLDGHVAFVRSDGGVFAASFDRAKRRFRSAPIPVLDGVRTGVTLADMTVSPTGTLVYIAGAARAGTTVEPVWVTRRGEVTPMDSGWTFVAPPIWGMALSPDGRRLALGTRAGGSDDIWIKEFDGGALRRLTFDGSNTRALAWSPDGSEVIYTSVKQGNSDLRSRRADGTGSEKTLLDLDRAIFEAALASDPAQLIVRVGAPATRDILLLRLGATVATPLVASEQFQEITPMVSRDGKWLAYASDESGRYEIYVRPYPDVNAGKWQVSRNGGVEPFWAHNGRELFFSDAGRNLVSVPILSGATFTTGMHQTLFSTREFRPIPQSRSYDVAPDDGKFVFTRSIGGGLDEKALPVVVVQNWGAEISKATRRSR